jgi:plastocyanin
MVTERIPEGDQGSPMMDEVRIKVPKPNLPDEIKFRAPLPILIPLVAIIGIAVVAFLFSRVLLNVPREAAVVIATVMAINILGAFAFAATRPLTKANRVELSMVVLYPLLIGAVMTQISFGATDETTTTEAAATAGGAEAPEGDVQVSAEGLAFDTDTIELAANKPQTIGFVNQDSAEHNISIYANADDGAAQSNPLFKGDIIAPGASDTYELDPLDKGKYFFQCDVHPTMSGDTVVG